MSRGVAAMPYAAAFESGVRRAVSSRAELLVRIGFYAIILVVTGSLWRAALDANGGELVGYDEVALLWYIAAAQGAHLASYPLDIFGGPTKVVLFTLIPTAFVTGLPASLLRKFDVGTALELVGAAVCFALLGIGLFRLGLRRYASGALWTRA